MPSDPLVLRAHARLVRQLQSIAFLSEADRAHLDSLPLHFRDYLENHDIVRENERPSNCCLVVDGLVCRYKMVAGGQRQILSIHFPGDLPDLQSLYLDPMDHSLLALTPATIAFIPHEAMRALLRGSESLERILYRHALIDASIFREWIANVGRRDGLMRVGHLICEMYVRMNSLGLIENDSFEVAMTQAEIGDATGLSPVHVNRVMQQLRALKLITSRGRLHSILNWDALQRAADFDPAYLHLVASA